MLPFTPDDFPITAVGNNVYRRRESGPICVCPDQETAAWIAGRLNAATIHATTVGGTPRSFVGEIVDTGQAVQINLDTGEVIELTGFGPA